MNAWRNLKRRRWASSVSDSVSELGPATGRRDRPSCTGQLTDGWPNGAFADRWADRPHQSLSNALVGTETETALTLADSHSLILTGTGRVLAASAEAVSGGARTASRSLHIIYRALIPATELSIGCRLPVLVVVCTVSAQYNYKTLAHRSPPN